MADPFQVECIVFDLDGVLVDSRTPIARCLNLALGDLGLAAEPEAQLHGWIGHSLHEVFTALLGDRGAPPSRVERAVERYRVHYRTVSLETRAFPGVERAIRELGTRHRLAVATSKPEAFARPILEAVGFADAFEHILGPPLEATHRESKTGTLERALAALAAAPRAGPGARPSASMVGDRRFDVEAGRFHGAATVGVTWGIGDVRELTEAGVDRLVHDPSELVAVFG